jgi:uroporphyrinogen decarboxylase
MAAFWSDFVAAVFDRILEHIVPDVLLIAEDMAYKAKSMISPAMTREYCMPSWKRWSRQLRTAGCPLVDVDSDGFIEELIPLWIESRIDVCEPIEVAAYNDIVSFRERFGRQMAYRGGVDKQAMARGGRTIFDELARIAPVIESGGFIPGCDHGVPPDVSWPDYLHYCRHLAKLTGWL